MNYFYSNKALLFLAISSFVCTAVQASQPDNPRPTKRRKLSSNQEQFETPQANSTKAPSSQQSLAQHKRERFQCTHPGCPKNFSQKSNMKQHVQTVHEKRRYQCAHCPKNFSDKSSMKKHVKAQHQQDHAPLRTSIKKKYLLNSLTSTYLILPQLLLHSVTLTAVLYKNSLKRKVLQ